MKKVLLYVGLLCACAFVPFSVAFADGNGTVNGTKSTTNSTTNSTNTTTNSTKDTALSGDLVTNPVNPVEGNNTMTLSIKPTSSTADITTVKIQVAGGKALEDFKCTGTTNWTVTQEKQSSGAVICTFKAKTAQKGASLELGKLTFTNKIAELADATDADCQLELTVVSVIGNTNPDTGASLPYVIVIAGLALAGIAYYNSEKKTKLHKI